jgi:hypothetical protein
MFTRGPDEIRIPFPHFALIYVDQTGHLRSAASESIARGNLHFFTPELKERFLEAAGIKSLGRNSTLVGL